MTHSDLIKSYLGQLYLDKSDFEAVETARDDRYFKEALAINARSVIRPAASTPRCQCLSGNQVKQSIAGQL